MILPVQGSTVTASDYIYMYNIGPHHKK